MDKIIDKKSAEAWLETQPHQVQVWIAARAALRAVPVLILEEEKDFESVTSASFRALIISAAATQMPAAEIKVLEDAAHAASIASFSATHTSPQSVVSSAVDAIISRDSAADALSFSVLLEQHYSSMLLDQSGSMLLDHAGDPLMSSGINQPNYVVIENDKQNLKQGWPPLWPEGMSEPEALRALWPKLKARLLQDEPTWGFWVTWYEALLDGNPPRNLLDLTIAIAKQMTVEDWEHEDGPAHVAQRIRDIQDNLEKQTDKDADDTSRYNGPTAEELAPSNVTYLFDNAPFVSESLWSASITLNQRLEAFDKIERPNERVPGFEPIRQIAMVSEKAATVLAHGKRDEQTQVELALLVGELHAQVARLEAELKAKNAEIEMLKQKPWYRPANWASIGMIGGVVTAVLAVSGDELGPETRCNNLVEYWNYIWRTDLECPPMKLDIPEEFAIPELPPTKAT